MYVGVLRVVLHVPAARSLKDKRKVVRSFRERVQSKLRLSVAEVGGLDTYQRAVVAVVAVSNEAARVEELLASAASMAGSLREAVLADRRTELLSFGAEGQGVAAHEGPLG